jgi:hypothetical protein
MNNSTPAVDMGVVINHAELLIEMAQHVPEVEMNGVKNHIAPIGMAEQPKWKWGGGVIKDAGCAVYYFVLTTRLCCLLKAYNFHLYTIVY